LREKVTRQLAKRLGRDPSEDEIDEAVATLHEAQEKEGRRRPDGTKPKARPFAWKQ
jgi:hypothetical protein